MEQIKLQLRQIVNTSARNLSKEQKDFIRETALELRVELPAKNRCNSCWIDTALACYNKIEESEAHVETNNERAFVLKPNVDVIFGGIRINAATLTDDLARRILARGFERKFFAKCE